MIDWNKQIIEAFGLGDINLKTYSPLIFAYIGDSVFDVIIRSILVDKGNSSSNSMHKEASGIVNARMQASLMDAILPLLSDEEISIYKRGKNAKPKNIAKNASSKQYHSATGLEALVGYLYLAGEMERVFFLIKKGLEEVGDFDEK